MCRAYCDALHSMTTKNRKMCVCLVFFCEMSLGGSRASWVSAPMPRCSPAIRTFLGHKSSFHCSRAWETREMCHLCTWICPKHKPWAPTVEQPVGVALGVPVSMACCSRTLCAFCRSKYPRQAQPLSSVPTSWTVPLPPVQPLLVKNK